MNAEIVKEVVRHAAETSPTECCGLVVECTGNLRYVRCHNHSLRGTDTFTISAEEYAAAEDIGKIVMIAHSHPFMSPEPSETDRIECFKSGLPWLIVNHPVGSYQVIQPEPLIRPLVGREFSVAASDCYTLVRDYYLEKLGIVLADAERPELWWQIGRSFLVENIDTFKFKSVSLSEAREHDMLLMQIGASVPNHCAVLIENGRILHHLAGRLSGTDLYSGYWRKVTTHCLRYVG